MALGGGTFVTQNKILPGSYINVISAASASAELSDRGIVAVPLDLKWGQEGSVITVEKGDFQKNCFKLFGYSYTDDEMKPLREIFMNAVKVFVYRLGTGVKAQNTFGTAKHAGSRGNSIKVVISTNVDDPTKSDVKTFVGSQLVDSQTVLTAGKTNIFRITPISHPTNTLVNVSMNDSFLLCINTPTIKLLHYYPIL